MRALDRALKDLKRLLEGVDQAALWRSLDKELMRLSLKLLYKLLEAYYCCQDGLGSISIEDLAPHHCSVGPPSGLK